MAVRSARAQRLEARDGMPVEAPARIRVLGLGGTIASGSEDGKAGVTPNLKVSAVLERAGSFDGAISVETVDVVTKASFALTIDTCVEVAALVASAKQEDCDAVVITQGTDTIEETAYGLATMLPRGFPVVITGAMRHAESRHGDGPHNLVSAIRVAATAGTAQLGPVVVANDSIHLARWVVKSHTWNVGTFQSPQTGPVGEIVEDRVHVWCLPAYEDYVGLPHTSIPSVELLRMYPGSSDAALNAVVDAGAAGIVLEGIGGGHVPPNLVPALERAIAAGVPVVLATRCAAGRVLERTYDIDGSEMDLIRRGAIPVGTLSGAKARVRLAVALALGQEASTVFPV